jgi:hypothetical protein
MPIEFRTPVMRLIEGDVFTPNTKNFETGEPLTNRDGSPRNEFYIGLAAAKTDAGWTELEAKLRAEATAGWAPKNITPAAVKDFSWKFYDGDGVDKYGKPLSDKNPAKAGNMVLRMTNGFPPQVYARAAIIAKANPNHPALQGVTIAPLTNGPLIQLGPQDASLCKKGHYFRAFGDAKSNDNLQSPGIYVNVQGVELVGFGEEIHSSSAKSGDAMFGDEPTPTAAAPAPTPIAPQPTAYRGEASPALPPAPAPYSGHMAPPPAPAPVPAGPTLTPAALAAWPDGKTVADWEASGWTIDTLKTAGYVA